MKKTILAVLAMLTAAVMLAVCTEAADLADAEAKAGALKSLGLFKGVSDTDFDLNREPTRVEALVMLIRTLGEEDAALKGNYTHPFTDVPVWADAYVGYAYETGLTKGISATEFGSGNASAAMYVTFMLRALGYSDANGDFAWDNPFALARENGIVTDEIDLTRFLRADAVAVSYSALNAVMKGSKTTLADVLIGKGVFTRDKLKLTAGVTPEDLVPAEDAVTPIFKPEPIYILPVEPKDPGLPAAVDEPAIGD